MGDGMDFEQQTSPYLYPTRPPPALPPPWTPPDYRERRAAPGHKHWSDNSILAGYQAPSERQRFAILLLTRPFTTHGLARPCCWGARRKEGWHGSVHGLPRVGACSLGCMSGRYKPSYGSLNGAGRPQCCSAHYVGAPWQMMTGLHSVILAPDIVVIRLVHVGSQVLHHDLVAEGKTEH